MNRHNLLATIRKVFLLLPALCIGAVAQTNSTNPAIPPVTNPATPAAQNPAPPANTNQPNSPGQNATPSGTYQLNSVKGSLSTSSSINGNVLTNTTKKVLFVSGHPDPLAVGGTMTLTSADIGASAYTYTNEGEEVCIQGTSISDAALLDSTPPVPLLGVTNDIQSVKNNIKVDAVKSVDPQFLKLRLIQAAQALASLNPWNGTAVTNQYGSIQGSTNTNSYITGQLTTAGQSGAQTTYNTGQPTTVQTNYTGQCPPGYFVSGITSGNGVTCTAINATTGSPASAGQTSLTANQVTTPTTSVQTQISNPAFAAAVPSQPTATGALSPSSTVGSSPLDVLSQQVELNSELLTYQALYNGLASDNSHISSGGVVGATRRQVTLAFPMTVSPYTPYAGAVAEVRVIMLPSKVPGTAQSSLSPSGLTVVNLLPASNTYNVAKATTNTKQFGAGVTLDLIGLGVSAGKTKSTLYLAKDTDTIAVEYANPAAANDKDEKRPLADKFRNLLPVGGCKMTNNDIWADAELNKDTNYDYANAVIFGWQFKPVLGNLDILPLHRLLFAQVALDNATKAPAMLVETRWREYDRKTGAIGDVYKDSCSWQYMGPASSLQYQATVAYIHTDDLGGGNIRITANGRFTDPNIQVRMGNAQRSPDAITTNLTSFEFYTTASALVASPTLEINSEGNDPVPMVTRPAADKKCQLKSASAHATAYADGTALVTVDLDYDKDRDLKSELPLVLVGNDVYGLRDHPFLPLAVGQTQNPQKRKLQFVEKMDALTTDPAVVVKDVNWSQEPITPLVRVGPTFTAVQSMQTPLQPAAASSAGTGSAAGSDQTASGPIAQGLYHLTGTGFRSICTPTQIGGASKYKCLSVIDSAKGTITPLDASQLTVVNDETARLTVDSNMASLKWPMLLLWSDDDANSEWSLTTKPAPPPSTPITADKSPKVGDSIGVVFSGKDFSTISSVTFESNNLGILTKDAKSITVLVTTTVTKSAGTKDLIATGADGKPIVLPLTVVAR